MAKYKHNKKRNTAFLYEALILELTKCILKEDKKGKEKFLKFIKESFSARTLLHQDLKLYHALSKTQNVCPITAEKILTEVKRQRRAIDKRKLLQEQNHLTRRIKKDLSNNIMSNFVPSYKFLATISQIFNERTSIKTKVLLENEIIGHMVSKTGEEKKMVSIDNLIYKTFANKFNKEYSTGLIKEQKELLAKFVSSFSDNGLQLKLYLNEEVGRLKNEINKSLLIEEFVADPQMNFKAREVLSILDSYKTVKPNKEMVRQVGQIQSLVSEIRSNAN
jgi:hypothetical protein